MAVDGWFIFWKIYGYLVLSRRCRPLPALEHNLLGLPNGIMDGAHPLHGGIEVGTIRSSCSPIGGKYDAKWDAMLAGEGAHFLKIGSDIHAFGAHSLNINIHMQEGGFGILSFQLDDPLLDLGR